MTTNTTTAPMYDGRTAAEWEEMSRQASQRSYDSFQRSDTDGFLSQWASDSVAREYDLCARLAEKNGMWEFVAVFDLDGNLVPAVQRENQYGYYWAIYDNAECKGRPVAFFNESKARKAETRNRNNAKKGYTIGRIRDRGRVVAASNGSWMVSYYVQQVDDFNPNAEVVATTETMDY